MHWFRRTLVRIIDQGGGALGQGTASVNAPVGYAEELTAEIAEPAEKTQGKSLRLLRSLQRTGFAFVSKATGDAACAMLPCIADRCLTGQSPRARTPRAQIEK